MSRTRRSGAGLGLLLLIGARAVWAQGPAIDHKPVGCVVADKFARFEARFDPAENVSRARIYFRAEGGPFWYFVGMKPQEGAFQGVIPKPKKNLKRINYYIDVIDKAFAESRTPDYAPEVAQDAGACSKKMAVASIASSASVTVGLAPGAPAIPLGFSASGVVPVGAAGVTVGASGSGATALILGGVAVVGAATAAAIATKGGRSESPPPPASTLGACVGTVASTTPYTLSGSSLAPQTAFIVDDTFRVFLNGQLIHQVGQDFSQADSACCTWPAFGFSGRSNDLLTVELSNGGGPFGLDSDLVVWRNGSCYQLLLRRSDVPSCCHPSSPCGGTQTPMAAACANGIYLTRSFPLP